MCAYTHRSWAHQRVSTTFLTWKNSHKVFLCSWRGSNLWSWNPLDLEADNQGKDTAAARAALPSPTSACWVFSCFRIPPNCDMDYRIFNVRTWSCLCVRIHMVVEHNIFDPETRFLVLLTGFEPCVFVVWILSPTFHHLSHPITLTYTFMPNIFTRSLS